MALSGTLVLFSLCRAKQTDHHLVSSDASAVTSPSPARLRPCLSSSEKRKREKARRGSMKRVRFAADVVEHGPARPAPEEEEAAAGARAVLQGRRDAGEPGGAVPRHAPRPLHAKDRLLLLSYRRQLTPPFSPSEAATAFRVSCSLASVADWEIFVISEHPVR
uniref:Uncharacterized protein n=1 Tax=Aegilops tauschii TaxID=37682 RepID=R7W0D9_AEGTA